MLARHDRGLDPHDLVAAGVRPVATAADLAAARGRDPGRSGSSRPVLAYIVALVRATRTRARRSPSACRPAAPPWLLHAPRRGRGWPGRPFVTPDEVKAVVKPALRHRIQLRPELELEGATADGVLDGILATVPVPR